MNRKEVAELIEEVHTLIRSEELSKLDSMLKSTTENQPLIYLVTLLRSSFPVKDELAGWKFAVENAIDRCYYLNFDPNDKLIGLI